MFKLNPQLVSCGPIGRQFIPFFPLSDVGADIVDVTNQESKKFGKFNLEDTWFDLTPNQQAAFDDIRRFNSYLRERYHSLRDILWIAGYSVLTNELPPR